MGTTENLKAAFAGESQANRMYLAFAQKAQAEGHPGIARLFRAVAQAETIHALAHFRVSGGVKDTATNLQAAINGEQYEFSDMYPKFVGEAAGNPAALKTFQNAMAVEKIHHALYSQALAALQQGKDLPAQEILVCDACGHTVIGEAPDECPICGVSRERFAQVA